MNRAILNILLTILPLVLTAQTKPQSQWVHPGKNGKLTYKTTASGDRIMDFSYAGYMGGGVALPNIAVKKIIKPSGGADDLQQIQAAIEEVAAMPMINGSRGAVLLSAGNYTCSGPIILSASGVILKGSGMDKNGTTIHMTGNPHAAIIIGRNNTNIRLGSTEKADDGEIASTQTYITDAYVPAGTNIISVADAKAFVVGDTVIIRRPVTDAWVHFMRMDDMYRDGKKETWIAKTRQGVIRRKIVAITGNKLALNIPVSDCYDARYLGATSTTVAKAEPSQRITQVGVENLHIQCPPLESDYGHAPYSAIRVGGDDCWVKDVLCEETMNATVLAGNRITMEHVVVKHTYTNLGASKPTDFSLEGSQNLIDRCEINGGNTYFVWTSVLVPGPNVLLNCTFTGLGSRIQPHQRWATGMLVDNCTVPDGGIDFMNRGVAGSGHGWTMGWAVAWNCIAKTYIIQNPPGATNWAIGCIGTRQQTARLFDSAPIEPEGTFDSHNKPVAIQSLYLAQLKERLGMQALKNIGYSSNSITEFKNKQVKPQYVPVLIDKDLGKDEAFHRPVNTSGNRENSLKYNGDKALDGSSQTYWAANDNAATPYLEVDMEGPVDINTLQISEPKGLEHVQEYKVEGQVNSDWKLLARGTAVGQNKIARFPKTTVWKVRLTVLKSSAYPAISDFGLYLVKPTK
ncbi:discoidin domain-containing protein [Mucilaginibacter sp. PPCGB 2223]|uniref:discoidin domain-containing protein n=1 Tax=Mucilaginibacter sp. PPCGB 2223 TaxID=1886027 RepID=UPI001586F4F1|nr:discoidin domain-containing protein [Mucilaginibacter sp. PPCGB 2223]